MRKFLLCVPLAAVFLVSGDSFSQRPDLGGRRGGGGGGGGGAPSPSFNRPGGNTGARRPTQGPTTRPSLVPQSKPGGGGGGGVRPPPNVGGNRPNTPSLPNRPGTAVGNRPGTGVGNRPGTGAGNRPGTDTSNRPGTGAG